MSEKEHHPEMKDFLSLLPSFDLAQSLVDQLGTLGFTAPTDVQTQIVPQIYNEKSFLAIAQTGTGKTLCYLIPIVAKVLIDPKSRSLILTPSRETADQVYSALTSLANKFNLTTCLASSGSTVKETEKQLRKLPHIIVATPGRLNEHLANNKLLLQGLKVLVLDEADRMFALGFEDQLALIHKTLRGERQTWMFAASFGNWAEKTAYTFMPDGYKELRCENAEAPVIHLNQRVLFVAPSQKDFKLMDELKPLQGGTIIFTGNQESCVKLGRLLQHKGLAGDYIHGDMNPGHRNRIIREFREQKLSILITTDLLARGLDIPHVNTVINYELPYKSEDFLHRIGRTARAGRSGQAITFITPSDLDSYKKIKKYLTGATEEKLSNIF